MASFLPIVYLMWEKMPADKRSQAWDTGLRPAAQLSWGTLRGSDCPCQDTAQLPCIPRALDGLSRSVFLHPLKGCGASPGVVWPSQ